MGLISVFTVLAVITFHISEGGSNDGRHAPCKILINEIKILNKDSDFLELAKYCPTRGRKNLIIDLEGYYLVVLTASNDWTVLRTYNFNGKSLKTVIEEPTTNRGRKRTRTEDTRERNQDSHRTHFRDSVSPDRSLAAGNVPSDRLPRSITGFDDFDQVISNNTTMVHIRHGIFTRGKRSKQKVYNPTGYFYDFISFGPTSSILICLLHYKSFRIDKQVEHFRQGQVLTDKDLLEIKDKLKDAVYIGDLVPDKLKPKIRIVQESLVTNPVKPVSPKAEEARFSINKCDQAAEMFNGRTYEYSLPSPGGKNSCKATSLPLDPPEPSETYPYTFVGQTIKAHGQKLVVNVLWTIKQKKVAELSKLDPLETAAILLNLSKDTIKRIQRKHEENSIGIPTGPKKVPRPVRDEIDSNKQRIIYEVLVSFYKENKVPHLRETLNKFLERVRNDELTREPLPENMFQCGVNTFRKILHSLGYKYGKINKRDAVLFNPRIVAWRGKYLKAIRDNDALGPDAKLPVIFTDETWFDTNSRPDKGWLLKAPKTVQEKTDFTYGKHKVSRGSRIIILHAGGEGGFVPGMMEVYPVSAKDVGQDYHSNINHESYLKWFNKLLDKLQTPHILIIDNAPYHSVSTAPTLNSRKQVLIDWLVKQKREGKNLPENLSNLRVFELQDLVRKLKQEEPLYRIDDLAKQKGHRVLRTPPYNCQLNPIELVWSDIKRILREKNEDQNVNANVLRAKHYLNKYTAAEWKVHVDHVKRLEQEYWEGDMSFETVYNDHPDLEVQALALTDEDSLDSDTEEVIDFVVTNCD